MSASVLKTSAETSAETSTEAVSDDRDTPPWLQKLDEAATRWGDWINPIMVKETRQALKSRQFVITFSVLLLAALGWTIAGSLSMMPQIYTSPSAARMLIGYYVLLALPMLVIVPLAAYRSLEAEIDDGTLELLSITALSPWQIVLGKLASAGMQMMLYLVTLFPCVAYAYTLRGVDLPMLALMMAMLIVTAVAMTVFALSFAPLARGRSGRITTLLVVLASLLLVAYLVSFAAIGMILYGNPVPVAWTVFFLVSGTLVATSLSHLMLTVTAAQLTPESENRSSGVRWSLVTLTAIVIGMTAFAIQWDDVVDSSAGVGVFMVAGVLMCALWTFAGAMLVAESSTVTPRIQRELPASFLERMTLTFFTPGPATGLVFISLMAITLSGLLCVGAEVLRQNDQQVFRARDVTMIQMFAIAYASYLIVFLNVTRWVVAVVRINNNPRVEIGIAAMIVVSALSALVPYSIGLHLNDYRSYGYSFWQLSNWVWTLGQISEGSTMGWAVAVLVVAAMGSFLLSLATVGVRALPIRTATPEAVLAARK